MLKIKPNQAVHYEMEDLAALLGVEYNHYKMGARKNFRRQLEVRNELIKLKRQVQDNLLND